jgi:hypothetical protein
MSALFERIVFLGTLGGLALSLASPAEARIGVTTATDGSVSVRQGGDLQSGQTVTTATDGRVHLMFVDGSAVTVGPGSTLTIESYAFDPATKSGQMTLALDEGTVRFVGGAISKKSDVVFRTPAGTVGIRGGISAVDVHNGVTTAEFLHGSAMRVTGQGVTQTATRSGSQITVATGASPSRPTVMAPGQMVGFAPLERRQIASRPGATATSGSIDAALAATDLGRQNSDRLPAPAVASGMPSTTPLPAVTAQTQAAQFQQSVHLLPSPAPAGFPSTIVASPVSPGFPTAPPSPPAPSSAGTTGGATVTVTSGTITMVSGMTLNNASLLTRAP